MKFKNTINEINSIPLSWRENWLPGNIFRMQYKEKKKVWTGGVTKGKSRGFSNSIIGVLEEGKNWLNDEHQNLKIHWR